MESVRKGEANRLLKRISKPLLDKQDISVQGVLPEKTQLTDSLESLVENLAGSTSGTGKDSGIDNTPPSLDNKTQ